MRRTIDPKVIKSLLVIWGLAVVAVTADLSAGHLIALPAPSANADMAQASARHVLAEGCGCSERVIEHLLKRRASNTFVEVIVLIKDSTEPDDTAREALSTRAIAAGYGFELVDAATASLRYGATAAPALIAYDRDGKRRYSGGYTDRKRSEPIRDLEILADVAQGRERSPLPIFGCAVAAALRSRVDPLSLR